MSWKSLVFVGLLCALAMPASAQPTMSISLVGGGTPVLNGNGNFEWVVSVSPDGTLAAGGNGSVATEVGLRLSYLDLIGVTTNTTDWDHDNPGVSPFAWAFTDGVETSGNEIMAALGSVNFGSGSPSTMVTIETEGPWYVDGSNYELTTILDALGAYGGNGRLAQAATNYDTVLLNGQFNTIPGDANLDGSVGFGDYNIWLTSAGVHWDDADFNNDDSVGFADYNIWLLSGGVALPPLPPPGGGAGAVAAVPEPASAVLLLMGVVALLGARIRR